MCQHSSPRSVLILLLLALNPAPAAFAGGTGLAPGVEACLNCHASTQERLAFETGPARPLRVEESLWKASIHGSALLCTECHPGIDPAKHPPEKDARKRNRRGSSRDYVATQSESCQRCHYAYYTRSMDSIHFKLRQTGKDSAPSCADCHPAHGMTRPRSREAISLRCGSCHKEIYTTFRNSVHGQALRGAANNDHPVCTDCHTAHSIADTKTAAFHASTPSLCAKCHSDEEVMKRNGLDTSAYTTYLDDFHGKSNLLYQVGEASPRIVASCTDCHGAHDIQPMGASTGNERKQLREKLVGTCRSCHGDVPVKFADAWLSHYPPRFDKAPALWTIKKFYAAFNPFMVGILVFAIVFDLWRVSANSSMRRKR